MKRKVRKPKNLMSYKPQSNGYKSCIASIDFADWIHIGNYGDGTSSIYPIDAKRLQKWLGKAIQYLELKE